MNSSEAQEQIGEYHTTFSHSYKLAYILPASSIMTPYSHISVFGMRWQSVAEKKKLN